MTAQYLQKCYATPGNQPTPFHLPRELGGETFERGAFLNSNGTDTGYFYGASGSVLAIYKSSGGCVENSELHCTIDFGVNAAVIDCYYFALTDKCPGVIVAVNDPDAEKPFYVAYVSLTKKEIIRKVSSVGAINSIRTIIDGATYPTQVDLLSDTFKKSWPHVACLSVYSIGAVLFHLGIKDEDSPDAINIHRPQNTIVLGRAFYSKESNDTFVFQADDGKVHRGSKKDFYVTAISFMPSCGVILLGFNFGGIYMVSLRTQRPYSHFFCEGVIEGIIETHADDDPRGGFYLWFLITRNDRASAISCNVAWSDEHYLAKNFNSPSFIFSLNFILPKFMQFLNVKTILTDRSQLAASPVASHDGSMNESNPNLVVGKSSSLSMFTWFNNEYPAKLYGCIFDMNQYYYKRLPRKLMPDRTPLKQVPCCAGFYSDSSIDLTKLEILDLQVIPESVHPFSSVGNENTDQLFYPSVYQMKLKIISRDAMHLLSLDSVQRQHLKECCGQFEEHWNNPDPICLKSHALGLADLPYDTNDRRYYLLNMLLKHRFHQSIRDFIMRESTNNEDLKFVARWLNKEVDVAKETLDKSCETLLQGGGISHSSLKYIQVSTIFFQHVGALLKNLIDRAEQQGQHDLAKNYRVAQTVANGLNLYTMGMDIGLDLKMLPHTECFASANTKLAQVFRLRSCKSSEKLAITRLVEECMTLVPDSDVWRGETADNWYPPTDYSTWLAVLININLSIVTKTVLFGYYLLDLESNDVFPMKRWTIAIETLLCPTNPEKLKVVKDRVQKMFIADTTTRVYSDNPEDQKLRVICDAALAGETPELSTPEDFATLPLTSNALVNEARQQFLTLPDGIHHWNNNVIKKRRYELILPSEFPRGDDSTIAKQSRKLVQDIKSKFPFLFVDNEELIGKVRSWAKVNGGDETAPPEQTTPKRKSETNRFDHKRKRSDVIVDDIDDDDFKLATPVKRVKPVFADTPTAKSFRRFTEEDMCETPKENRAIDVATSGDVTMSPVVNSELDNNAVSQKQWERIRAITRTPPSTPLVSRAMMSPEPSTVKQPTSILKSNKKKSIIRSAIKRPRLQFNDVISEVKSIPNRHDEKAPQPDHFTTVDSFNSSIEVQDEEDEFDIEPSALNFDAPGPMDDDIIDESPISNGIAPVAALTNPVVHNDDSESTDEEDEGESVAEQITQSFEEQIDPMDVDEVPAPASTDANIENTIRNLLSAAAHEIEQLSQEADARDITLPHDSDVIERSFEEQDPNDYPAETEAEQTPIEPSVEQNVSSEIPEPVDRDYSIEAPSPVERDYSIEIPVIVEAAMKDEVEVVERSFEEQASDDDNAHSESDEIPSPEQQPIDATTSEAAEVDDVDDDDDKVDDENGAPEGGDAPATESKVSQLDETIGERVAKAHAKADEDANSIGARVHHTHEVEAEVHAAEEASLSNKDAESKAVTPPPTSPPKSVRRSARARKPVVHDDEVVAPVAPARPARRRLGTTAANKNEELSEVSRAFLSQIRARPTRPSSKTSSVTSAADVDVVEKEVPTTPTKRGRKPASRESSVEPQSSLTPSKRLRRTPSREASVEREIPVTPSKRTRRTPSRENSVDPPVTPRRSTRSRTQSIDSNTDIEALTNASKRAKVNRMSPIAEGDTEKPVRRTPRKKN